jgi:glycosyltransferase involved in cell wall biosynthesis
MIVGWLFPDRERCGIAIYSRNYISALEKHCDIKSVNSDLWLDNPVKFSEELNSCDLIHIQYEPSFFSKRNHDYYTTLLRRLKRPLIVSLHEVYRQFPGVYPRDQIRGGLITSSIKKWYYDFRHPLQTAYTKHVSSGFGASQLLVHHQFQKRILEKKVPQNCRICVIPHPVMKVERSTLINRSPEGPLKLGTTGFINPEFNYPLLYETLEKLKCEWKFFWIGGLRIPEHRNLLDSIKQEIDRRDWTQKFIITDWVSDETQNYLLEKIDIYCAFFKNRSSSGSLARAMGACRCIIATESEIVHEINAMGENNCITAIDAEGTLIAQKIDSLSRDTKTSLMQLEALNDYSIAFDFDSIALRLIQLYKSIAL